MEIEFVPLLLYIYLLEGKSYLGGSDSSEMWVDENEKNLLQIFGVIFFSPLYNKL